MWIWERWHIQITLTNKVLKQSSILQKRSVNFACQVTATCKDLNSITKWLKVIFILICNKNKPSKNNHKFSWNFFVHIPFRQLSQKGWLLHPCKQLDIIPLLVAFLLIALLESSEKSSFPEWLENLLKVLILWQKKNPMYNALQNEIKLLTLREKEKCKA